MKVKATYRLDKELVDIITSTSAIEGRTHTWYVTTALKQYFNKPTGIVSVSEKKPAPKGSMAALKALASIVDDTADKVIDYLNMQAGTQYRCGGANQKLINARLKEFTKQDMFEVISKKCDEWKGTEMARYLRPSTLFNATKFEEYLNQKIIEGNTNGTNRYSKPRKETALESMAREQKAMDAKREALRNNEPVLGEDDSIISTQVYSG
jgi:uncharacterized phage protein (TIGR02220 family)